MFIKYFANQSFMVDIILQGHGHEKYGIGGPQV